MSKYLLKPVVGTIKQGSYLEDENNNIVYEGKMLKFSLFGSSPYEFYNHITNKKEEHKLGKTVTIEESNNGMTNIFATRSYFKYDGVKIWDYLHDKGVRLDTKPSSSKIGVTYIVSFEGKEIATLVSTTPKGKSLITTNLYYDVTCDEKDLDLVFLVAFSIARTEQLFHD